MIKEFEYDVCVVGVGRVGLPLALSFIEEGLNAAGLDIDEELRKDINNGKMPFKEPGYDEIIRKKTLYVFKNPQEIIRKAKIIIITVGTPLFNHIETDLTQIQRVLNSIKKYLKESQLIVLRSTVSPGTTQYTKKWIEKNTPL